MFIKLCYVRSSLTICKHEKEVIFILVYLVASAFGGKDKKIRTIYIDSPEREYKKGIVFLKKERKKKY